MSVGIKVLRLSRPSLHLGTPCTNDGKAQPPLPTLDLSLVSNFANVFVGETFSSMFVVSNLSQNSQYNVTVSISIKPPSEDEFQLVHPELSSSCVCLDPHACTHHVVNYEVKEDGLHVLTATISYSSANNNQQVLRKHYKFSAAPALNVKTKLTELPRSKRASGSMYTIEAQIENTSPVSVILETLELLPAEGWLCQPIGSPPTHPLVPKDVWQYAAIVRRDADLPTKTPVGQGRLTLGWRREPFGERGWLTTGPVKP